MDTGPLSVRYEIIVNILLYYLGGITRKLCSPFKSIDFRRQSKAAC